MNNGWQRWALGITVGIILASGGYGLFASGEAKEVEQRLNDKIEDDYLVTMDLTGRLIRIETMLKDMKEDLEDISDKVND